MSGWIITIDGSRPHNWDIAKDRQVWATTRRFGVRAGDDLFFWMTRGRGLVAHAVAAEDARPVSESEGVPWPDHAEYNYVSRFGLTDIAEVDEPISTSWSELRALGEFTGAANQGVVQVKSVGGAARLRELIAEATGAGIPPTIRNQVEHARSLLHSTDDARQFVERAIAERQGQPLFRRGLIEVYGGRCCVTACDAVPALEAAHIAPFRGAHTNQLWNGLLLRSDIHTLFDLFELTVDAVTRKVRLSKKLQRTQYAELHGIRLKRPKLPAAAPAQDVLSIHNQSFTHRHSAI